MHGKMTAILPKLSGCYQSALMMAGAPVPGSAEIHMSIDDKGNVTAIVSAPKHPQFARCAQELLARSEGARHRRSRAATRRAQRSRSGSRCTRSVSFEAGMRPRFALFLVLASAAALAPLAACGERRRTDARRLPRSRRQGRGKSKTDASRSVVVDPPTTGARSPMPSRADQAASTRTRRTRSTSTSRSPAR